MILFREYSRRGRVCFPHAQAVVLPDLTQLGEELPFSGHSCFLQSGIGYVFLCVLWSGTSSLMHKLFGVVFPCCEPCSLLVFWGCCLPHVLLVVVLNFVLGHC